MRICTNLNKDWHFIKEDVKIQELRPEFGHYYDTKKVGETAETYFRALADTQIPTEIIVE